MTGTPIVDDVRAANEGTVRVDRDYLRALEILANEHFESAATRSCRGRRCVGLSVVSVAWVVVAPMRGSGGGVKGVRRVGW